MIVVFLVTVLGVYINAIVDYPWKGFAYAINGSEIEGAKEWTTMGMPRLAGFTRMSTIASFYIACAALFLYEYSRSWWHKLLVVLVAFPAILLTTNKSGIGAFMLGLASTVLVRYPRLLKLFLFSLASILMSLPFSKIARNYELDLTDPISLLLLASFEDRLINTWPNFLAGVSKFGNLITGVGFGGIGTANKYFASGSRHVLAVSDNFALYLYGCFGITIIGIYLFLAYITVVLFSSSQRLTRSLAPVMVAFFAASFTTDVIETQIFALMLGIAIPLYSIRSEQPMGGVI